MSEAFICSAFKGVEGSGTEAGLQDLSRDSGKRRKQRRLRNLRDLTVEQNDRIRGMGATAVNAEVVLKATNADGVYDEDPKTHPNARLLDNLSYQDVTTKDLSVMDMTAITLCQENNIPVVVFNLNKPGNFVKAIVREKVGTFIAGLTVNNIRLQRARLMILEGVNS